MSHYPSRSHSSHPNTLETLPLTRCKSGAEAVQLYDSASAGSLQSGCPALPRLLQNKLAGWESHQHVKCKLKPQVARPVQRISSVRLQCKRRLPSAATKPRRLRAFKYVLDPQQHSHQQQKNCKGSSLFELSTAMQGMQGDNPVQNVTCDMTTTVGGLRAP